MEYKKCNKCGIILSTNEFSKYKASISGLQAYCKQCYKHYLKNYYKNNRETMKAQIIKYSKVKRDALDNYYVIKTANLDENSPQELIDIVKTRIKIKRIKRLINNGKEKRKITA